MTNTEFMILIFFILIALIFACLACYYLGFQRGGKLLIKETTDYIDTLPEDMTPEVEQVVKTIEMIEIAYLDTTTSPIGLLFPSESKWQTNKSQSSMHRANPEEGKGRRKRAA